jgi:mono/diheme cytochrome c family protein
MKRVTASLRFGSLAMVIASGCDNRVAFQEPDPTLARMLSQRRADPYESTSAFADGKVLQDPPRGTVPIDDDTDAPPPPVTRALLELGHTRFDAVCAVCHGITGTGESVVATKMELRPAPSIVNAENRARTRERLYQITTQGYGLMAGYADMLSHEERWAVVAYLQALQLSQHAPLDRLPPPLRERFTTEAR